LLVVLLCTALAQQDPPPDPKFAPLAHQLFLAPELTRAQLLAAQKDLATPDLVRTMSLLAGQVFDRRDYAGALPMYQATCAVAAAIGDTRGQASCTFNLGLTESRLFHVEEALALYNQSLALYQSLNRKGDLVAPLNSIAILLNNRGDMRQAIPYYEHALADAAASGNEILLAQTNSNLGNVYHRLGNYRQAIQCLQTALEITKRKGTDRQAALVMNNLGTTYYDQHDLDLALSYSEQSLAIREKRNDPVELASSVLNIGVVHEAMGNTTKASAYFERALQLTTLPDLTPVRIRALYNLGNLLFRSNQIPAAKDKLEETIKLAGSVTDYFDANNARVLLGEIADGEGQYADAEQLARTAVAYSRQSGERQTLVSALDLLGVSLRDQGKSDDSEAALQEAILLTEQLREQLPGDRQGMIRFMDDQTSAYLHMVQLQLDRKRPEAALAYVERSKARSLLEILQTGNSGITKAMTPEERDREGILSQNLTRLDEQILRESQRPNPDRKRIAGWGVELEKARAGYRSFETVLYAAHPRLKVQRVAFDPARIGDLASALPDSGTALLDYSIGDAGIYLFVLTRGAERGSPPDLRVYKIGAGKDVLLRDVKRYREQVATRDLAYRKLAGSLYRELIQPAADQLRGKTTLVIAPDGFLWQLPFQALQPEPDRYLLQDRAIFYTPSLSVLHEMQKLHRERKPDQPRLLAVDATQLPASRREVEGLRQLYGQAHVQVFTAAEADQDRIRREAPNYEILHLAAHGVFQDRSPMNSYLVLAKAGKPEAGVFEAREMIDLNLHADMVVLSGCETGRGNTDGSEGLIGMAWALFVAGSPSTVASQWKVESESTTQLMLGFHRNLKRSTKAKALQLAALDVMKNPGYRHPFYWSGFVLMGEGF
jgi:CHAT domain-containing protein/tetratricopeptide (TPR) repeat protein